MEAKDMKTCRFPVKGVLCGKPGIGVCTTCDEAVCQAHASKHMLPTERK